MGKLRKHVTFGVIGQREVYIKKPKDLIKKHNRRKCIFYNDGCNWCSFFKSTCIGVNCKHYSEEYKKVESYGIKNNQCVVLEDVKANKNIKIVVNANIDKTQRVFLDLKKGDYVKWNNCLYRIISFT